MSARNKYWVNEGAEFAEWAMFGHRLSILDAANLLFIDFTLHSENDSNFCLVEMYFGKRLIAGMPAMASTVFVNSDK